MIILRGLFRQDYSLWSFSSLFFFVVFLSWLFFVVFFSVIILRVLFYSSWISSCLFFAFFVIIFLRGTLRHDFLRVLLRQDYSSWDSSSWLFFVFVSWVFLVGFFVMMILRGFLVMLILRGQFFVMIHRVGPLSYRRRCVLHRHRCFHHRCWRHPKSQNSFGCPPLPT